MKKGFIWTILMCFVITIFLPGFSSKAVNPVPYKSRVGLNVHWSLGGSGYDTEFEQRLAESKTKWAREHFYMELLVQGDVEGWLRRYDEIMAKYKSQNIKVIGMLAYNKDHNDFRVPNEALWREFVALVVARYKDDVKVWEVWNEPDSPDFLVPNNPKAYGQILKPAYKVIKMIDPSATVVTGGLSWPNIYFAKQMYQKYGNYFDGLGVHAYYCGRYFSDGKSLTALEEDLDKLREIQKKYKPNQKMWITEFGCSTGGTGISEAMQKEYFEKAMPVVLERKYVKTVLVYTIRNRDINNNYEDHFGLLHLDMSPRQSWNWYDNVKIGPYGFERQVKADEQKIEKKLLKKLKKNYFKTEQDRKKYIPRSDTWAWKNVKDAYVYGGYNVKSIAYFLKFGKTVNYKIAFSSWKKSKDYKKTIKKKFNLNKKLKTKNQKQIPKKKK